MQVNNVVPYEADHVSAPIEIPDESPTPESIRRTHARAEANIKALGVLCLIGALWGALRLITALAELDTGATAIPSILFSVVWFVAAARCSAWLCTLDPRGRLLYTLLLLVDLVVFTYQAYQVHALLTMLREALAAPSMVAFEHNFEYQLALGLAPLLVRFAFLYVLWSRQGRMVMSRHYRHTIIPATPGLQDGGYVHVLLLLAALLLIAITAVAVIGAL